VANIVHLIPHDGIGGVEVAARSMAERGGQPDEFTLLLIAGRTLAVNRKRIMESPFKSASNPLAHLRAVRLLYSQKPAVLICSLWRSIPAALLVRLLRPRTRLALFLHLDRPAHLVDALLTRLALWAADEVWADSAATLAARRVAKPSRVISFVTSHLIAPDIPDIEPLPQFVIWSRLNWQKGIDRSIRLIGTLAERGTAAELDIWGPDGGEQRRLEALITSLGLHQQVRLRGILPHGVLGEQAARARFFLQLSRFEGMAIGCVEAMQLGLVPVATPTGEMAHYIRDGENGLIVDGDEPDEAAARIQGLMADPERYRGMRRKAIEHWREAATYADDVLRTAEKLAGAP
jgi:glycosyltransferase involved in cell wall biosynthesis